MSIREMFGRINSVVKKECGRGATDQEIADAERALSVRFPRSYRAFLSEFGWAEIRHDVLYGLGCDVPSHHELVRNTLCERHQTEPLIPPYLVPIMNDGAGNNYCLDTSRLVDEECPVVFWDHEHEDGSNQSPVQVASSFDRWIVDRITDSPYANEG